MFVSVSRGDKPLASISLVSADKRRAAQMLLTFLSQGGCTFTLKRRQRGGRCIEEELGTSEIKYQVGLLMAQSRQRPAYTPVHLGPSENALRSKFCHRVGARG
jgi:hypothetical protein